MGGQLDGGPEVVELVAGVVAAFGERVAVHVLLVEQQRDGIGQLDLATDARLHLRERVEDLRA